jgi:cell division transport system ATP-binding protein
MISFSHVSKRYPGSIEALRDVTLEIAAGELVALTGHSGAGKSTLLKLLPGIERPTQGSVVVSGQNVGKLKPRALPWLRRNFGLVFEDVKLLYDRSAYDNVLLPLDVLGFDRREAARRVRAALDKVGLLARERANPLALSGGEQKRLAIARAIVHRPAVLLADEPTGNLDAGTATGIGELFRAFHQVGVTVIVATHDRALIAQLAPRTVVLDHGALAA